MRVLLRQVRANASDEIQHQQRSKTQSRVELGGREILQRVDNDHVRSVSRVDATDAHQLGDLASNDVDCRASHEGADGGQGNELDEPAKTGEAKKEDDGAGNDGKG